MRVLLPLHGFVRWNGGLDLIRVLASALTQAPFDGEIQLFFAMPEASPLKRILLARLRAWRSWRAGGREARLSGGSDTSLMRTARSIANDCPVVDCADSGSGIAHAASSVGADVVFPTMYPLGKSRHLRVGYIFDFQHRHLPQLFSPRTRRNRDKRFSRVATDAHSIVVNARTVAEDAMTFLGVSADRILVLPFSPYARSWWFDTDPIEAQRRHNIEQPYVLICNHFWTHKDHKTAIRALALLKDHPELHLVLTGDPIDHRDPQHYGRLVALTEELGLGARVHFLGLIAKSDQLALLRGCRALLQPTLFEGGPGGGSVYEAVGLGVPVIASDIAINREIDRGSVTFFRAGNCDDLAEKMSRVLAVQPIQHSPETLMRDSDENLSRLATAVVSHLRSLVASRH